MNHARGAPSVSGGKWKLIFAALAAWTILLVLAVPAAAQESRSAEGEAETATSSETRAQEGDENLVFQEGKDTVVTTQATQEQAAQEDSEPLEGAEVDTRSTDPDIYVEVINITRPTCTAKQGASVVLEDEDGTQADFLDNDNVQITETREGLRLKSNQNDDSSDNNDIEALNVRGGDDVLDTGGLTVVTSTDITCEDGGDGGDPGENPDDPGEDPDDPGEDPDDPGEDPGGGGNQNMPPDDNDQLTPEPQDAEKGPLAGGTAKGKDILVKDDNNCGPQQQFDCIDQVVIETENCEFTAQGDNLTVTLEDPAGPFRIRDGDNVDFTIDQDGTITANGRKVLGDSFPPNQRDNPDRVLIPIPVDPENFEPDNQPNSTFPIVSSTGIGGEGCQVVKAASDSNDPNGSDGGDDVIDDTIPNKPLPNTGGMPLLGLLIVGLALTGAGFSILRGRRG